MKLIDALRAQLIRLMQSHPVIFYKLCLEVFSRQGEDNAYLHLETLEDREIAVLLAGGFIRGGEGIEKMLEPIVHEAIIDCVRGVNTGMEVMS